MKKSSLKESVSQRKDEKGAAGHPPFLGRVQRDDEFTFFIRNVSELVFGFGIEMNGFSLFQKDHLGSQCKLQLSLIDKNKLLSRVLVLHHLMLLFGLNGDHERPEVFIRGPGG